MFSFLDFSDCWMRTQSEKNFCSFNQIGPLFSKKNYVSLAKCFVKSTKLIIW